MKCAPQNYVHHNCNASRCSSTEVHAGISNNRHFVIWERRRVRRVVPHSSERISPYPITVNLGRGHVGTHQEPSRTSMRSALDSNLVTNTPLLSDGNPSWVMPTVTAPALLFRISCASSGSAPSRPLCTMFLECRRDPRGDRVVRQEAFGNKENTDICGLSSSTGIRNISNHYDWIFPVH